MLDTQWWKTPEQRYEETVPKLRQFAEYSRAFGGPTFVDATGICNGRDVDYYKSLSAKTGVHIVAATASRRWFQLGWFVPREICLKTLTDVWCALLIDEK